MDDATPRELHQPIRCDYCGDELPNVKSRAHIPTTPDLQRRGFAADKIVCPECAAGDRGHRLISREEITAAVTLAAFEVLVREEAQRRGLLLESAEDFSTGGIWIRWSPGAAEPEGCYFQWDVHTCLEDQGHDDDHRCSCNVTLPNQQNRSE